MQVRKIIEDFLDNRAYVSHTLCKHRLFLGLETPTSARDRLADACVWPLVAIETERLIDHSGTLYGLWSTGLDAVAGDIRRVVFAMRTDAERLLASGNAPSFKAFRAGAEALNQLLSGMSRHFDGQSPEFSAVRVDAFLKGRTPDDCVSEASCAIGAAVLPEVRTAFAGGAASGEAYRRFWPAAADAFLLLRTALVAGYLHGFESVTETGLRDLQKRLRRIERVVSCWSPGIPDASRERAIAQTLRAEGYPSTAAIVMEMEALAK